MENVIHQIDSRDFLNSPPFDRSVCFYMTISGNFERFQYFRFSGKWKAFSKNWITVFCLKALRLKTHHFHAKLPCHKPMLRQIEWWMQNWLITNNGVLPVTILFFWKFCFSFRTSYKELIWRTNDPNVHIRTFCKRWSFLWRCFFAVSILNFIQEFGKSLHYQKRDSSKDVFLWILRNSS